MELRFLSSSPRTASFRALSRHAVSLLLVLALGAAVTGTARAADDPVAELRLALMIRPSFDPLAPAEKLQAEMKKAYDERDDKIAKIVQTKLKSLAQLRQALVLKEWGDVAKTGPQDPQLIASDAKLRGKVAQQLRAKVRQIVQKGDDLSQVAVATLLTEIGLTIRSAPDADPAGKLDDAEADRRGGFARSLTEDILKLCHSKSLIVRMYALRALAGINANPVTAAPEFAQQLKSSPDVKVRRIAADGFLRLVTIATYLRDSKGRTSEVWASQFDVISGAEQVARYAPIGLQDTDEVVKANCADALRASATALADLFKKSPDDGKLKDISSAIFTPADVEAVKQTLKAYQQAGGALAGALEDPSPQVRLAAIQTLERLSDARYRIAEEPVSVEAIGKGQNRIRLMPPVAADPLDLFAKGAWQSAARLLSDPDPRIRLAAVKFLEWFPEARPTDVPDLTRALCDDDLFVRWAAARALSVFSKNYQPKDAVSAVPALGNMLFDPDYNVRLAAAATLEALRTFAENANPALAKAVNFGDVENRVAAIYVIESIGPERSRGQIPVLTDALKQIDPRVRRAAAEALGRYGALARNPATLAALQRALGDEDGEVRTNASEAILEIVGD